MNSSAALEALEAESHAFEPPLDLVADSVDDPHATWVCHRTCVARDGERVAFVAGDGLRLGIYLWQIGTESVRLLVAPNDHAIVDLAFSPGGDVLSYVASTSPPMPHAHRVAWARADVFGEAGSTSGSVMAWSDDGRLIVVDHAAAEIASVDPLHNRRRTVAVLVDDGDVARLPVLAAGPNRGQVAFASHQRFRDRAEVWRIDRGKEPRRVCETAHDVGLIPFWHPRGKTLGVWHVCGDEHQLYAFSAHGKRHTISESGDLTCIAPPAWSPSGRFCAVLTDPRTLTFLDLKEKKRTATELDAEVTGAPRFLRPDRVALDGGARAVLVQLSFGL